MREADWSVPPALPCTVSDGSPAIRLLAPPPLALLTGDLGAALGRLGPGAALAGYAPDPPPEDAAGYRIAADRALLTGRAAQAFAEGWHGGFATSRCDGAWVVAEIGGPGARDAMSMLVAHPLDTPSPSAAMLVSGRPGMVVRLPGAGGWRLLLAAPDTAFHAARLRSLTMA